MRRAIEIHNYRTAIHELFLTKNNRSKTMEAIKELDYIQGVWNGDIEDNYYNLDYSWQVISENLEYIGEINFRDIDYNVYDDGQFKYDIIRKYHFSF